MKNTLENLNNWLIELEKYVTPRIEYLPDLDLYMDQVINYLEKCLGPINEYTNDKIITNSMINNYVKGNVVPNPINKKYSRTHLIYIIAVCTLKQILPISDIARILTISEDEAERFFLYDVFRNSQDETMHAIAKDVLNTIKNFNEDSEDELKMLALKLAVQANASKMISERILYFLAEKEKREIEEIKAKAHTSSSNE